MTTVTASALRQDVYRLLDEVLASGIPLEVERKGKLLRIVPAEPVSKLSRLAQRASEPGIWTGDRDLDEMDWTEYATWNPAENVNPGT